MKTWHGILAAATVALGGLWVKHRLAADADEIGALRGSMTTLARSVDDADRTARSRTVVSGAGGGGWQGRGSDRTEIRTVTAGPAETTHAASAPDENAPTPSVEPAIARAHLDAKFESQERDAGWSANADQLLERKLAAVMPPSSTLKSVECKATMCRVEMVYDDMAQYHAFLKQMTPDALPWNGALYSTIVGDVSTDGPMTFVAFLAREGEPLAIE